MSKKFWNWVKNEDTRRTLYLEGAIAEETWYGDEVTPKQFKSELMNGSGDITIWINSPGGDVFCASQIYNMLMEYKGKVTIKIDGIAASAASVIAMAGSEVLMSPVSMLMIHNPSVAIFGEAADLQSGIDMLSEVKESIINAYELKTGMSRSKLSKLMDSESWFNAKKAVELGFADGVLFQRESEQQPSDDGVIFSKMAVVNSFLNKLPKAKQTQPVVETGTPHEQLLKRLELLK